ANTVLVSTRRVRCRRCSRPTISRRCSACAAPSTRPGWPIRANSSPRPACAATCPVPTGHIRPRRPDWPSGSDPMDEALLDAARSAAGRHVVREPGGVDDHVDGVVPSIVIEPDSTGSAAATLAWASRARLSVVVRGGGTRDRWGRAPRGVDVLVRLNRLNRIVAHEPGDLTATVEAGATLEAVNAAL